MPLFIDESNRHLWIQMTGRGYRRLNWFNRLFFFRWEIFLPACLLVFSLAVIVERFAVELSPREMAVVNSGLFIGLLLGGGWLRPSIPHRWMINTAKRGFLRDLYLTGMTARDFFFAMVNARLLPHLMSSLLMTLYFIGRLVGEHMAHPAWSYLDPTVVSVALLLGGVFIWDCSAFHRIAPRVGLVSFRIFPFAWAGTMYLLGSLFGALVLSEIFKELARYYFLQTVDLSIVFYPILSLCILALGGAMGFFVAGTGYDLLNAHWDDIIAKYLVHESGGEMYNPEIENA